MNEIYVFISYGLHGCTKQLVHDTILNIAIRIIWIHYCNVENIMQGISCLRNQLNYGKIYDYCFVNFGIESQ